MQTQASKGLSCMFVPYYRRTYVGILILAEGDLEGPSVLLRVLSWALEYHTLILFS